MINWIKRGKVLLYGNLLVIGLFVLSGCVIFNNDVNEYVIDLPVVEEEAAGREDVNGTDNSEDGNESSTNGSSTNGSSTSENNTSESNTSETEDLSTQVIPTTSLVSEGYYKDTYGLTGEDLKEALNDIITEGHGALSYSQVYTALEKTDEDPNDPSKVVLFYKGVSVGDNELRMSDDGDIWNREHIWAKSHGDFGTDRGPGTDLHMIRATDASVNARRGHLDFDESDELFDEAYDTYVDDDSFEPRDEVKGDVARMLFYMATRYEGENGEVELELSDRTDTYYMTDNGYGEHGKLSTLLKWHVEDPVDDVELTRNEVIYTIQGNRNPFIDHPEFVDFIWGSDYIEVIGNLSSTDADEGDVISIYSGRSKSDGTEIEVVGVVTFAESDTTVYIQDVSGGIRVDSFSSGLNLNFLNEGQQIKVYGKLDTYKGEKELVVNSQSDIEVISDDVSYEPAEARLIDISDGFYQGQLVIMKDVTITEIGRNTIEVEDEYGFLMNLFYGSAKGFDADAYQVGDTVWVTGIASWYNDVQIKLIDDESID